MSKSDYTAVQIGKVLNMHNSKVSFNMALMGLKSPFSNHNKAKPDDTENEFWNAELHERMFNF